MALASAPANRDPAAWELRQPYGPRVLAVLLAAVLLLT